MKFPFARPGLACRWLLPVLVLLFPTLLRAGWSFDSGYAPEPLRDLLVSARLDPAPEHSWLRLRGMERSAVRLPGGGEEAPWAGVTPPATVAERRQALMDLRAAGFRLVAFLRWPANSWHGGVRPDQPLRRTPLDLREAHERSRRLAETYGDLIDYWEIENEPDISFVEENPETYAAFLKACYLGIQAGRPTDGPASSEVLMAPLALPPGPYFEAFVANDGLRHTDGFNYHYYGYAEDFSGVYWQFRDAVAQLGREPPASAMESVFSTWFHAAPPGWQPGVRTRFDHAAAAAMDHRQQLQQRPLARDEPPLVENGRWLVSTGVTVEEDAAGWRFHITSAAPGPLRPAMAELPLPSGWQIEPGLQLAFQHRIAPTPPDPAPTKDVSASTRLARPADPSPTAIEYPAPEANRLAAPQGKTRELPVLLTEYGYGLLGEHARRTTAGRLDQRAWFAAVTPQIRILGIEGAMAFLLRPYIETHHNEFGLLMTPESGPPLAEDEPPWGELGMSSALTWLLADGREPIVAQRWSVPDIDPSMIVIDFRARSGLVMAKSFRGHVLSSAQGEGELIIYNFGREAIAGELILSGTAWMLADGTRQRELSLNAGERSTLPVRINPAADRFESYAAGARFIADGRKNPVAVNSAGQRIGGQDEAPTTSAAGGAPAPLPLQSPAPVASPAVEFEAYIRTANGNLYQTWPRLLAREDWQWYAERFANFTAAFYGRAHLPWRLEDNEPAALVFFFRPEAFPVTYEIRHVQITE